MGNALQFLAVYLWEIPDPLNFNQMVHPSMGTDLIKKDQIYYYWSELLDRFGGWVPELFFDLVSTI